MRNLGVVTVARSDYGIYRPVLRRIRADPELGLWLYASGAHLLERFGRTEREIAADGFPVRTRVAVEPSGDSPEGVGRAMGSTTEAFAAAFARERPDLLLVLGDRYEMHAAALAAVPFNLPLAHIHGGELSEGAFDDALRHSLTKLSHLHFTATEQAAGRVRRMGEEPWRVLVSGAPGLDNLREEPLLAAPELEERLGLGLDPAPLLVTFHPATREYERTAEHGAELLAALESAGRPCVFTMPNADTRGSVLRGQIEAFVARRPEARAVESLGSRAYLSLLALCAAVVGNSSSALIEAPSLGVPAVNVGDRQRGRQRAENVIDVDGSRAGIAAGIRKALDPAFRARLRGLENPYGDGRAAGRIVARLKEVPLDERLLLKRFVDA